MSPRLHPPQAGLAAANGGAEGATQGAEASGLARAARHPSSMALIKAVLIRNKAGVIG